jgi:uncharacterized protein YozE (UPF0346 family)
MTFFEFASQKYDEEWKKKTGRDFTWDLVHDARRDSLYPTESSDRKFIRAYLRSQHASSACLECFERAFDRYEQATNQPS